MAMAMMTPLPNSRWARAALSGAMMIAASTMSRAQYEVDTGGSSTPSSRDSSSIAFSA